MGDDAARGNSAAAGAESIGLEQAIQYERDMQAICMGTRDAAEGRSAFAEKRYLSSPGTELVSTELVSTEQVGAE
jgi:enoyl-CoA hydratase/carnithine racemase